LTGYFIARRKTIKIKKKLENSQKIASRFLFRFAQQILSKSKLSIYWTYSQEGLTESTRYFF